MRFMTSVQVALARVDRHHFLAAAEPKAYQHVSCVEDPRASARLLG
jgi:hypothetical protein